ncbi:hypothetical protein E4U51_006833 [Claviceps purpurea]|nr:hypothetical protein E4U51_006833 [Claviceps purpurea]
MVSGSLVWLSGLAVLVARAAAAAAGDDVVTSDTFFYGQSPAVYPSRPLTRRSYDELSQAAIPGQQHSTKTSRKTVLRENFLMGNVQLAEMTGGSEWATAHGKAKALVAKISLLERVSLTGGAFSKTGCSGTIAPIPRLNFSGMCLSDSGNGLRNTDLVNAYPAGLHVGASWNKALTRKRGAAMGGEFRRKGVNVFLGPPDRWLGPRGESSGVVETGRAFRLIRTCRAVWRRGRLRGFKVKECRLVSRGPGVAAALAGMDVAMPSPAELWGKYLVEAVKNGFVPESRVTDMSHGHKGYSQEARVYPMMGDTYHYTAPTLFQSADLSPRILTACYQFGQDTKFPNPGFGMPHSMIAFWNPTNRSKAEIGKTGPSWKATCWSRIPKEPYPCDLRDRFPCSDTRPDPPGADVLAPSADEVSLDMWRYGQTSINVGQAVEGLLGNAQPAATKGTLMGGGGSGGSTAAVFVSPYDALSVHAAQDDTALYHDLSSAAGDPRRNAQQRRLPRVWQRLGQRGHPIIDRPSLSDTYTDTLVKKVASQCNNTMVVLHNAGPRLLDEFADHPNVTAILMAHLPGRESGTALVKLLYGEASPSGKFPYTLARKASDYGHLLKSR